MASRARVVLIDGSALVYRAFFAIPGNFSTTTGVPTNAIYGFATTFRKLMSGRRPDYGAVIFDAPGATFRDEKYPEYKANRPRMAPDLRAQLPYIDRVVEAHRFPMLRVPGYEADDVIGTLAKAARARDWEVFIVSVDKDFAQLISDDVKMLDTFRDVTYDPELVRKKWGVVPEKFVDYLALIGDKVDNVPGVPGIGAKGAVKLLDAYGDLDNLLANTDALKGRQKKTLEDNAELARLSRDLVTIDCEVELELGLDDLALENDVDAEARRLDTLYRELEFFSLLPEGAAAAQAEGPQLEYAVLRDADGGRILAEALAEARDPVAFLSVHDVDNPAKGPLEHAFVGLLVRTHDAGYYLAWSAEHAADALAPLRDYFLDAERQKVGYNVKFLYSGLRRHGLDLEGVIADVLLASFLAEPTKLIPHRLDQIAREYLQRTLPPLKQLVGAGKKQRRLAQLDPGAVAGHLGTHGDVIFDVWSQLRDRLEELELDELLTEVDLPLTYVLGDMERDGIRADPDDLERLGDEFQGKLDSLAARIYELAGHEFNIGSTKQLSTVLFEELELPVIKKTKTGYSTNAEVLQRLAKEHEIAEVLLEHRKLAKLINTYTDVLKRELDERTGRIHTTFQQTVGATGRLITTDPDLQRTPIKTAEGRRIRQAFVPAPGLRLISADWSQIELRLLAHFTGDEHLVDAFGRGDDLHRRTAARLFEVPPAQVDAKQRGVGKLVNFSTIYGQGATALGQILDIPRKQAQAYIEGYFDYYAGVRSWLDRTMAAAHQDGYVTTLLGRRRWIPELSSNAFMERQAGERIAANTPIQGSAADICKLAMLHIAVALRERELSTRMLLQIHDELVFEGPPSEVDEVCELVRDRMENVVELDVPLVVDIGVGDNWAAAKDG